MLRGLGCSLGIKWAVAVPIFTLFNFFPLQTYFFAKSHLLSMLKWKKSDRWRKKCDQSTPALIHVGLLRSLDFLLVFFRATPDLHGTLQPKLPYEPVDQAPWTFPAGIWQWKLRFEPVVQALSLCPSDTSQLKLRFEPVVQALSLCPSDTSHLKLRFEPGDQDLSLCPSDTSQLKLRFEPVAEAPFPCLADIDDF